MNTNINLLLHADEGQLRRSKRIKIFNIIAAVSLVGVGALSLIIFILIQLVNVASIKKEQEDAASKIAQFQTRQAKLFILNNRVENIDKILKTRKDLSKVIAVLLQKVPSRFSVNDFEVTDKSILISGQSNSLSAIGEFINNLTDMVSKKEVIKSLTLNSVIFDESKNIYQVSVKSNL